VFANRKLPFKTIIMAIWEEISAVKGMAALHLTRKLGVQYKTGWVLLMKIREAIGLRRDDMNLRGTIQIDGKYVGGIQKPENKKEDRLDFRLRQNQNGKRRCIMAMREANIGAPNRTITRVIMDENNLDSWAFVKKHVRKNARIVADEHKAYDDLIGLAKMTRVNHSRQFMAEDGTNTNVVEGFFARIERAYVGVHHRFSMKYLDWYAASVAWKEDTRYMGLRWQMSDIVRTIIRRPISRNLSGYWQGAAQRMADQVWVAGKPVTLSDRPPKASAARLSPPS
jgi:hypothetical protein